jgi:hypothetical protein
VLVVVMTDGLENSSTDYDAHGIAALVRTYDERPNWTFVYLGAGHESVRDAWPQLYAVTSETANGPAFPPRSEAAPQDSVESVGLPPPPVTRRARAAARGREGRPAARRSEAAR